MPGKIEGGKRHWEVRLWNNTHEPSKLYGSWYLDGDGELQKEPNPKDPDSARSLDGLHEATRYGGLSDVEWLRHLPHRLNGMIEAEPVGPEWNQGKTYDEPGLDD
jgi:hypothetical protein